MIDVDREGELLAALRGRDPERDDAVRELAQAINQPVFALALRMTGNPTDAEEAVQETLVDVLRGVRGFRGEARFSTWVYRIGIRAAMRVRARHRRAAPTTPAFAEEPIDTRDPSEQAIARENANRLLAAIDSLPAPQRSVLALSAIDNLPQTEIAEILGVPVGTVYSRLHAAREQLRERLRGDA